MNDKNWFDNVELRPHPWPGLCWITPLLYVHDVARAKAFYENSFLAVPIFEAPDSSGKLVFVRMRYRGANFVLNDAEFFATGIEPQSLSQKPTFSMYLYVDNVETVIEKTLEEGGTIVEASTIEFWGDLRARIKDPFGYVWDIASKVKD